MDESEYKQTKKETGNRDHLVHCEAWRRGTVGEIVYLVASWLRRAEPVDGFIIATRTVESIATTTTKCTSASLFSCSRRPCGVNRANQLS